MAMLAACAACGAEPIGVDDSDLVDAEVEAAPERMFAPEALDKWDGLRADLDPANVHTAKRMAWLSGVVYADDFGDIERPGYIFRHGFYAMGFGYDGPGTYALTGDAYDDEGELWWRAGHALKPLLAKCPELDGDDEICARANAIKLELFTQLPPSRGIGKLHGQTFEGLGRYDVGTTQAFVLHDRTADLAVVAFRGTQQAVRADIAADLAVGMTDVGDVKVHGGFHHALHEPTNPQTGQTAAALIVERLDALPPDTDVFVTGHSLGGALATLFAWEAMAREQDERPYTIRGVYTFGAPGVGNAAFGRSLNERLRSEDAWQGPLHPRPRHRAGRHRSLAEALRRRRLCAQHGAR